jgi:hypothetical protein
MKRPWHLLFAGAALAAALVASGPATADFKHRFSPLQPVACAALAIDPANGLAGNPVVKSATSEIIAASGPDVARCQVDILYGTNPDQNINVRVGLPLNSLDGGTGGVEGAWNGRTQGIGGGLFRLTQRHRSGEFGLCRLR